MKRTGRIAAVCLLTLTAAFALLACGDDGDPSGPLPADTTLYHLTLTPSGDLLVGGSGGALLRLDGQDWRREASGTTLDIHSVAASTRGTYFGAGDGYTVGEQEGGLFEQTASGDYQLRARVQDHNSRNSTVRRVLADDEGRVWAFGDKGAFRRFVGEEEMFLLPIFVEGLGLVAEDATLVAGRAYAVVAMDGLRRADDSGILQEVFDNTVEQRWDVTLRIKNVAGVADDDLYVAGNDTADGGDKPFIGHFDGTSWTVAHTPAARVYALHARGTNDIFAAGADGLLLHFDGTTWTSIATGTSDAILALAGTPASGLYLLTGKAVLRYDGQGVSEIFRVGETL